MKFPAAVTAHLPKLHLTTLVLAAVFFVMPWTEIQCSGKQIATQSGVQAIYSGATLSPDLQRFVDAPGGSKNASSPEMPKPAYLVGVSLGLVALGAVMSIVALCKRRPLVDPGLVAGLAMLVLVAQLAVGFPVDRWAQESQPAKERKAPADPMALMIDSALSITTQRTNWFFAALFALAIPTGVLVLKLIPEGNAAERGFDVLGDASRAPDGEA